VHFQVGVKGAKMTAGRLETKQRRAQLRGKEWETGSGQAGPREPRRGESHQVGRGVLPIMPRGLRLSVAARGPWSGGF